MTSPARAHKLAQAAKQSALSHEQSALNPTPSAYALALAQMAQHKRQLASIQSSQLKRDKKKTIWQEWQSYVEGALSESAPPPDPILAQLMVWAFDSENTEWGVKIGVVMVENNHPQPEGFTRDTPSLLAEIGADAWLQDGTGQSPTINHSQLERIWKAIEYKDIYDISRAKLLRALAESLLAEKGEDAETEALALLEDAVKTWPKVGAKPLLRQLRKQLETTKP